MKESDPKDQTAVVPHALDEVSAALPLQVNADFGPIHSETASGAPQDPPPSDPLHDASRRAQEAFDRAVQAGADGDEAHAVQEYLRAAGLAESAREWYLTAVCCQRVGDYLRKPPPPADLERSLRMYRRAAAAYENSGLYPEARELSYRVMLLRMQRAKELHLPPHIRFELFLFWISSGFGYRPLRVIAMSIMIIILYGGMYWFAEGAIDAGGHPVGFLDSIYFSGVTFSTVGYGDLVPARHARLLALTESFIGPFLLGFFVVILSGRITKT